MAHKPYEKYMQAAEFADASSDASGESSPEEKADASANPEEFCRLHVCPACDVQARAEDTRLRALAETENIKKRLLREQEEKLRFAAERILSDLLPTLDSLDLALQYGVGQDTCANVIQGIEMTKKLMLDALKGHGFEATGEQGEVFSPECHEAMGFDEAGDVEDGHVARVLQRGYRLKERLLRPAKVLIAKR